MSVASREIPYFIAVVAIVVMLIDYILEPIKDLADFLRTSAVILAGFAIIIAAISLTVFHLRIIRKREPNYIYSVICLVCLWGMVAFGLIPPIGTGAQFLWTFTWINAVAERTVYSSLAFWIIAAAYRVFRVRTLEATVLVVTAIIGCFANAPISAMLGAWKPAQDWLLNIVCTATYRGITICTACGMIALCLRTLIGRERRWEG